mmetsp:Transcript_21568/g.46912  ORF Transcript_21568/g.46912 Transcript_21568/m.46912 type:complete len:743 (+) Transcript_21568:139-2367(+)
MMNNSDNNVAPTADVLESDGHKVAITWFLQNACTSNVDLAVASNVCRHWREVASEIVVSEAVALANKGGGDDAIDTKQGVDNTTLTNPSFSSIRSLLITDMARELVVRQQHQHAQNQSNGDTTTTTATSATQNEHLQNNTEGNFCLSWFAPSGIQTVSVPLDDDADALDVGVKNKRGRKVNVAGRNVTCCSEWRGYRHASEVLVPFGYSTDFVTSVMDASSKLAIGNAISIAKQPSSFALSSASSSSKKAQTTSHEYNPTYAVRGATLARPEGFCLCADNDYIEHATTSSNFQKPSHAATHCVPSCIDEWMNDYDDNQHWPLQKNLGLSPQQRKWKQNNLAKSLLPRMVMSTRWKYPLLHRFAEEDADTDIQVERQPLPWEKRQRAVQFLNSDRSQAIKLITPHFECGPAQGPVTVFIVAITTEDGCFLSGRSSRFELGHLYPLSSRDMQTDMSPISIATGKKDDVDDDAADRVVNGRRSTVGTHETSSDDDNDSTDSERSMHCLCKFDSGDPFNPKDLSIEDPSEDCIHRGCTGPGLWHCYSAVFDGKDSLIRVDGCTEPKRTREHYGLASSDDEEEDSPANAGKFVGSGILDGLSIGSDHQFDMSLCYGEIEGECGQGAIAELAVFKGRMDDCDMEKLEKYLMKKHGILSVEGKKEFVAQQNSTRMKPLNIGSHLQEDEFKRQAHAMIDQKRPWNLEGKVPLRVAANHHTLTWHRTNEITGLPMRITRIGAKNSNGSSDW